MFRASRKGVKPTYIPYKVNPENNLFVKNKALSNVNIFIAIFYWAENFNFQKFNFQMFVVFKTQKFIPFLLLSWVINYNYHLVTNTRVTTRNHGGQGGEKTASKYQTFRKKRAVGNVFWNTTDTSEGKNSTILKWLYT